MNICMLTSEFPPDLGGISYGVYDLSRKLIKRGHSITVITRGTWKKSLYEELDGIHVYRVRFIPWYPSPFWLHGTWVNRLFKSLESDFDLLHVQGSLVPFIHTSLPVVHTSHGTTQKDIDNMAIKSFHFFIAKLLGKQLIKAERDLLYRADVITAVSRSCANELKIYYGIEKEIVIIYAGVDTGYFTPRDNNHTGEAYVLYTGRLETRKGIADLIEAAKYVCQKYPDTKFILTGKGTVEKHLKELVNDLNLEKNFYFPGYVDRDAVIKYYQNATVYVLPSYYEGLPTTLRESMSCGIPTVATNVEGSSELIADGETGLLVPPRDPQKLSEAILKLLDNEELRKQIGLKARRYIEGNCDYEIIADRIEAAYESALSTDRQANTGRR